MAKIIQRQPKNEDMISYHHGLIRIIVEYELKKHDQIWEQFLHENIFVEGYISEEATLKDDIYEIPPPKTQPKQAPQKPRK